MSDVRTIHTTGGNRISRLQQGVNIVTKTDGSTVKIVVEKTIFTIKKTGGIAMDGYASFFVGKFIIHYINYARPPATSSRERKEYEGDSSLQSHREDGCAARATS